MASELDWSKLFSCLAEVDLLSEVQLHRDGGKQSTPQRLSAAFLCRSSSRDHESEIIAKLCNIAQLRDHFRSILLWWGLVHKRGEPCFS